MIRTATNADIPFILEGIIEAEKSGTTAHFFNKTFGLSDEETKALITKIFEEEIENQEWYVPGFWIMEQDGEKVACLSAWIENEGMESSGILKAQLLSFLLGNKWQAAADKLHLVSSVQVKRTPGALQLECIYTAPKHRGHGHAGALINAVLEQHPGLELAEIELMVENEAALRSYTKCGFLKTSVNQTNDLQILNLLPGTGRMMLQAKLKNGNPGD